MKRVLIVDDNAQNLYLLRVLLEAEGFVVDEAVHGGEALLKARRSAPQLVVSDLLMPVMDGYTLLRQWKSDPALRAIPFVVYTATYVEPKDERLALAMGADAFMVKPTEPDVVLARLAQVLLRVNGDALRSERSATLDDQALLAQYNEVLVHKLEKRTLQLEQGHAALRESEERFRATFEQAAVGMAHVAVDGRILRANDKLCAITGYPRDELLKLDFESLAPSDMAPGDGPRSASLAGTLNLDASERRCWRKDGSRVWVSLVSTLLRDAAGGLRYFVVVVTDITERKVLEAKYQQAQKLESVGQLTAGIAHDFNNLLTVIIGNADLLVERLADEAQLSELAEMTRSAALRGAELTQRLLAFARRQTLSPRAVDVNELLSGLEGMLRRMLPESIDFSLMRGEALWPALVDASQLEAAVINLVINSRDAMPTGGRLIMEAGNVQSPDDLAASYTELSPGAYVTVAVRDTGTGISPEHLARVFDPFFTTKEVGKGSGLGLSMVYGFAKQSRGHVVVCSELGHGATVRLYLPRATREELDAAAEARPGALHLPDGQSILLVEDEALVRRFASHQLVALGYRVVTAVNGREAMDILRTRSDFDLLLTDVVMPGGMTGLQLAEAAQALHPGLKVLFSSGYADHGLLHGGRLDPGVNLLSKPYGRKELALRVGAMLSEATPPPAPTTRAARAGRLLVLDDDPMVAKVLSLAAQRLGFEVETTFSAADFLARATHWAPTHVAIDLAMPGMDGVGVLNQLAAAGCDAQVIIASGADAVRIDAALDHARGKGLSVAGALTKPFAPATLRTLLGA